MSINAIGFPQYQSPYAGQAYGTVLSRYPVNALAGAQTQSSLQAEFPIQTQETVLQQPAGQGFQPTQATIGQETVLSQYALFQNYLAQFLPPTQATNPVHAKVDAAATGEAGTATAFGYGSLLSSSQSSQPPYAVQSSTPAPGSLLNTTA